MLVWLTGIAAMSVAVAPLANLPMPVAVFIGLMIATPFALLPSTTLRKPVPPGTGLRASLYRPIQSPPWMRLLGRALLSIAGCLGLIIGVMVTLPQQWAGLLLIVMGAAEFAAPRLWPRHIQRPGLIGVAVAGAWLLAGAALCVRHFA